jgi:hypothetical protein
VPVPETASQLVPLVASEFTIISPPYLITKVGANVTVIFVEFPGGIDPDQLQRNPKGQRMFLTVSVELPLLAIVNVRNEIDPTGTLPKARLPIKWMMRVCRITLRTALELFTLVFALLTMTE